MSLGRYSLVATATPVLATCALLVAATTHAEDSDVRWRVSDQDDTALLVTSDSEATDNFGPLLFHCKKGTGLATVEGDMDQALRTTIATMMLHDEEPGVTMEPQDSSAMSAEAFTGMTGWHYRFMLDVSGPAFQAFEQTGNFRFKIGDSSVSSDFKVGLENVHRFQDLCKRPPPQ